MARFRLKENHPLAEKFLSLMDKAEELGISIALGGSSATVTDTQTGLTALLEDIESAPHQWGTTITDFPPSTDYKLTIEKADTTMPG